MRGSIRVLNLLTGVSKPMGSPRALPCTNVNGAAGGLCQPSIRNWYPLQQGPWPRAHSPTFRYVLKGPRVRQDLFRPVAPLSFLLIRNTSYPILTALVSSADCRLQATTPAHLVYDVQLQP